MAHPPLQRISVGFEQTVLAGDELRHILTDLSHQPERIAIECTRFDILLD